jgi:Undecaprenyl-phosphate glucose phosphotransferase
MAEADQFIASNVSPARIGRDDVVHRLLLCAMVAAVEGGVASLLVFGVAVAYHLLGLHQTVDAFHTLFYAGYGLLTGAVYATFAAIACGRFLERMLESHLDVQQSFFSWTATIGLILLIAFLFGSIGDFSRVSLTSAYLVGIPVVFGVRRTIRARLDARIRRGELHFETIAVIGNRIEVLNFLLGGELWRQGHKLTGTLYFEDARDASGRLSVTALSEFAARSLRQGTDNIVLAGTLSELDEFEHIVAELNRYALNLLYAPAARNRALKFLDVVAVGPNNVLRFVRTPMNKSSLLLKRCFDLFLSALGLVALSPLFALVALAIAIESSGPIIYRQARRGFNGDAFMIWKFRSMSVTESGYKMKQAKKGDPRITRVGRFIRATSIDELPQLVNVLLGQMSLVGPRPHAVSHDEELSRALAIYAHRQRIKPGITGWAQVNGFRGETNTHEQIVGRTDHDIHYINNWSLIFDIWILILTVFSMRTHKNVS